MTEELTSRYSRREEYANIATHAVGVLLSIVALVLMVVFAAENGDPYRCRFDLRHDAHTPLPDVHAVP